MWKVYIVNYIKAAVSESYGFVKEQNLDHVNEELEKMKEKKDDDEDQK